MSLLKGDYPIIINHKTGLIAFPNHGSMELFIVGLKREPETADFEKDDIEWIKAVLHFTDTKALKSTINLLTEALTKWEKRNADTD
jgi:hypothetical protein